MSPTPYSRKLPWQKNNVYRQTLSSTAYKRIREIYGLAQRIHHRTRTIRRWHVQIRSAGRDVRLQHSAMEIPVSRLDEPGGLPQDASCAYDAFGESGSSW